MKLRRAWSNTMEIIPVTAIVKLNSCIKRTYPNNTIFFAMVRDTKIMLNIKQ